MEEIRLRECNQCRPDKWRILRKTDTPYVCACRKKVNSVLRLIKSKKEK